MVWEYIEINNGKNDIFCNTYITEKNAMNIIITHTPICTTLDIKKAYEPFSSYPVNVFAIDFSGTGNSGGNEKDFSLNSIINDIDAVVNYIQQNYSSDIHLYGTTGIGGMLGQYYVCTTDKIKSFAQFACVEYKNTDGIGVACHAKCKKLTRKMQKISPFE